MKKSTTCIRTAVVIGVVGAASLPPAFSATGSKSVGTLNPQVVIAATCADLRNPAFVPGGANLQNPRAKALSTANQSMTKATKDELAATTPEARESAATVKAAAEKVLQIANALPIASGESAPVKAAQLRQSNAEAKRSTAEANMLTAETDDEKRAAHQALKAAEAEVDDAAADTTKTVAAEPVMAASAEPKLKENQRVGEMLAQSAGEVVTLDTGMEALRAHWDALGSYYRGEFLADDVYKHGNELLKAREKLADCALEAFDGATAHMEILSKVAQKDALTRTALARFRELKRDYLYIAQREIYDRPQLTIFAGPSLSLNGDDKFKTGFETAVSFDGGAGSLFGIGRVFTDIAYRTKGSVDVAGRADANGVVNPPNANALFRSDKGYLRFNVGASTKFDSEDRYALFTVAGVSTIPGVGGDFPSALRPRYGLGIRGQTFLSEGTFSRLSLSVAHDEYWRQPQGANATNIVNSYERGVIEALLQFPNAGTSGLVTSARLTLDTPLDGKGPSEVRLSVLASFSFADFFKKILAAGAATPQ